MSARACGSQVGLMVLHPLHHRHQPSECGIVFASFKGNQSPLCHTATLAPCPSGGYEIRWTVQAEAAADSVRLLPFYIAQRTTITRVSDIEIP
jgi:hypothetical protein